MGNAQSRHPSFRVNGGDVIIVISEETAKLLDRLPYEGHEVAYEAMLELAIERLVKRRGVTKWERELGVVGLDVATADAGDYRAQMVYVAEESIVVLSLIPKSNSCSSNDDDDDDDDHPPSGPGGRTRGTFAERLAGELQASADESEHEPPEIGANRAMLFAPIAGRCEIVWPRRRTKLLGWLVFALSSVVAGLMSHIVYREVNRCEAVARRQRLLAVRARLSLLSVEIELEYRSRVAAQFEDLWAELCATFVEIKAEAEDDFAVMADNVGDKTTLIAHSIGRAHVVAALLGQIELVLRRHAHDADRPLDACVDIGGLLGLGAPGLERSGLPDAAELPALAGFWHDQARKPGQHDVFAGGISRGITGGHVMQ